MTLTCDSPEQEDIIAEIAPLRRNVFQPLLRTIEFQGLELLQLSEFYRLRVSNADNSIERIIMIPTEGIPDERENAVVSSIVKDRRSFVEYVSFILGEDYLMSAIEAQFMDAEHSSSIEIQTLPALYERMLKTALANPEKLKEIEYLLRMVNDQSVIPEEFRRLYNTFRTTLKLR